MKRKQSWPSLLLFAALLAIAVSPASALAGRGDRQSDLPGEPLAWQLALRELVGRITAR